MGHFKRLRLIASLMVVTLLLVIAFLGIWLKSSYRSEQESFHKALKVQYIELVQTHFTNIIQDKIKSYVKQEFSPLSQLVRDTLILSEPSQSVLPSFKQGTHKHNTLSTLEPSDSHIKINPKDSVLFITISDSTIHPGNQTSDSLTRLLAEKIKNMPVIANAVKAIAPKTGGKKGQTATTPKDTIILINDVMPATHARTPSVQQLPGKAVAQAISDAALKETVNIMSHLDTASNIDTVQFFRDYADKIATQYKGVQINRHAIDSGDLAIDKDIALLNLHLFAHHYQPYLRARVLPQLLFSVFLVLLCSLTFYFSYRTLVKQQLLTIQKNDFISNTTHELKTPITTAQLALEAFAHFDIRENIPKTMEYIAIANEELKRLEYFVLNVLNQMTLDQGAIRFQQEEIDLKALLESSITKFQSSISLQKKEITLTHDIPEVWLKGDRFHLDNAISNILDNAIKYGDRQVHIRVQQEEGYLSLTIDDDGDGIAIPERKKVFEKFYRIHSHKGHVEKVMDSVYHMPNT